MRFILTDVFAEKKYSGNQLATFVGAQGLSSEEMQQIAREINFSETTFILTDRRQDEGYPVRIFTPAAEVDFAGHPTLGTAFVVRQYLIGRDVGRVDLNMKAGRIPVSFTPDGSLWMRQLPPVFGQTLARKDLAEILGLPPAAFDPAFPVEEVSTGMPHIIVPLRRLEDLRRARVVRELYFRFVEKTWAKNILLFCPEPYSDGHSLSVRMFADYLGVPEDPATGSGNGCLAGYLVKHRYLSTAEIDLRVGQGYEIGRPSLLALRAAEEPGGIRVAVGGKVNRVAAGEWG